jgi:hypothetical protein
MNGIPSWVIDPDEYHTKGSKKPCCQFSPFVNKKKSFFNAIPSVRKIASDILSLPLSALCPPSGAAKGTRNVIHKQGQYQI